MRIKLLKDVSIGEVTHLAGSVLEHSDPQELIKNQEAVEYTESEIVKETKEVDKIKQEMKMSDETKVEQKVNVPNILVPSEKPLVTLQKGIHALKKGAIEAITLKAPSGASEGTAGDGGVLVIQGLDELQGALEMGAVIYPKCRKLTNWGANEYGKFIPYRNESTLNTTSAPRVYEPGEGNSKTATKMAFNRHDLKLGVDAVVCYASDEILSDVNYLQEYLIQSAGGKLYWMRDYNILNGTYSAGVQGCIGIFTAGASNFYVEPVAHNATYTGLIVNKIMSGVDPRYRNTAEWYMSNSTHSTLVGQLGTGTTVSTQPIFSNNNMTLCGRPINIMTQMAAFGSATDILFGDFAQYTVAQKGDITIQISKELAMLTDETVLRFTLRYLGAPNFRTYAPVDSVSVAGFSSTSGT